MASISNTAWERIKGEIAVAAALTWGEQPKNFHDLAHAIADVVELAMRAGQTIGINETAANARRQFAQMHAVMRPAG